MKHSLHFATALAVLLAWGGDALAQTPKVVHIAGKLTDANGDPIADETVNLNFKLYDDSAAGDLKYNEPHTNVPISGGWFDVYLGSSVPLSPGNVDYESLYIQVDVNGVAMTPRIKAGGALYALAAYKLTDEGVDWLVQRLGDEGLGAGDGGPGERGPRGYSCWDLNGNGQNDANEDANGDGAYNALDCQGPPGERGLRGYACWDLNANGNNDANEDANGDGAFNGLDCQGEQGEAGDAADAVAAVCNALVGDPDCNLAQAVNQVCGCQDVEPVEVYAGSLPASNGRWNYDGVGVPGADRACNAQWGGSAACEYSDLVRASGLGELVNPVDSNGANVNSWWANDNNANVELQCSHDNANEAPWTYQTADQGDQGLFVTVNRANGNLADPASQAGNCANGSHWVACCY